MPRREVMTRVAGAWRLDVETMLAHSPLVEVTLASPEPAGRVQAEPARA